MSRMPLDLWLLRRVDFKLNIASVIWPSLLSTLTYIILAFCWLVGRGNLIFIGIQSIVGISHILLYNPLLAWLHGRNPMILKQFFVQRGCITPKWLSSTDIGLTGDLASE